MTDNRQRVIDRARAVAASWEQWCKAPVEDRTVMWGFVERGMKFLTMALDEMDQCALAEMAKINQETGQYD